MARPMGFFTDTTVCIGCKACEVACKEWNQLPATNGGQNSLSGNSYDNTRALDGIHWRHVAFVEQFTEDRSQGRWLMMSEVCKHCVQAGCLEVCPTGAIVFGALADLRATARDRLRKLHGEGEKRAYLYGADEDGPLGGLNAFFLLVDEPEVYGLPRNPRLPSRNLAPSSLWSVAGALAAGVIAWLSLGGREDEARERDHA